VLGSQSGRYQSSSLLMVYPLDATNGPKLARIDHFAKCTCVVKTIHKQTLKSLWFMALSFFHEHNCKAWFGYPTEVWTTVTSMDMLYIPLTNIQSQVAYCSTSIDFSPAVGSDTVFIVVPV